MSAVLNPWPGAQSIAAVQAELNYLAPGTARPVGYTFEPPSGTPWNSGEIAPESVVIHDGRSLAALGDLSGASAVRPLTLSASVHRSIRC